jgi:hypothetical protein
VRDLIGWYGDDVGYRTVDVQDGVVTPLQAGEDSRVDDTVAAFSGQHPHVRASFGSRHRMDLHLYARALFVRREHQCSGVLSDVDHDGPTRHREGHRLDVPGLGVGGLVRRVIRCVVLVNVHVVVVVMRNATPGDVRVEADIP